MPKIGLSILPLQVRYGDREALEIAKRYEDEDVVKFINGILGSFVRAEFPDEA